MSERNRVRLRLVFEDGTEFSTWDDASIRENYTDPLGDYSFTVTPPRARIPEYDDALSKGSIIKFYLDTALQATVIITTKRTTIGEQGVTFQIQCKTLLCTPYEGNVNPDSVKVYTADTTVSEVIAEVMLVYGFSEPLRIEGAHDVSLKTGKPVATWNSAPTWQVSELKHKEAQPQPGETVYGYCSRICSRVGAILHINADGVLVLSRPIYNQPASYSLIGGAVAEGSDMMLNGITITDTNDDQFAEVVLLGEAPDVRGQKRTNRPSRLVCTPELEIIEVEDEEDEEDDPPPVAVIPMKRKSYRAWLSDHPDSADVPFRDTPGWLFHQTRARYRGFGQAGYKPKIIVDKRTRDQDTAWRMAVLAMSSRASNAYQIRCSVDGAKAASGAIWAVNTMASVSIPVLNINEDMWVLEKQLSMSRNNAQVTNLTLIPKNALLLDAAFA